MRFIYQKRIDNLEEQIEVLEQELINNYYDDEMLHNKQEELNDYREELDYWQSKLDQLDKDDEDPDYEEKMKEYNHGIIC